ncbi:MAG: hypothetical protein AB3X44_01660 [Leptothrix sp. (in: b-proteobacteria)]
MPIALTPRHHGNPSGAKARPAHLASAAVRADAAWQAGVEATRQQQHAAALRHFEQAVRLAPQDPLYWLNLASSQRRLDQLDPAIASARRAWQLDRSNLVACHFLAECLRLAQRPSEMLPVLDALAPQVSRDATWFLLQGAALVELHRSEEAAQAFLSVLALAPSDDKLRLQALTQLGHCLANLRRHADAAECYRTVLDLAPLALEAALYAAHYSGWACDWPAQDTDLQRLQDCIATVQQAAPEDQPESFSPFCLLTLSDDPALSRWAAELACRRHGDAPAAGHRPVPQPGGRLRIGLLSSDFHHHATSMLLVQVLEALDRQRFELFLYSNGPDDRSVLRQRVHQSASGWFEVAEWSNERLAAQIRADRIGVLIDLKGYTSGSRTGTLALRPAPLQVAWLGYPGTSGARFIDYIVGDRVVTPLAAQADFTEQIAQLPHCYQPNDRQRSRPATLSRTACGLPEDAFVFASFNQAYKIIPVVFSAWCQILAATPGSVLWLLVPDPVTQARLRSSAAAAGLDPARLVFAPFLDIEPHRARLPQIDLFLDTFPCGGHTTASDALWAGVPLLTLQGQSFASRVAASLLHTLKLPELVCDELDRYMEQAIALAHDPAALQLLRARVEQGRDTSPLFDGARFAQDLGALLLRMVARHDAGLAPAALAAEADAASVQLTALEEPLC